MGDLAAARRASRSDPRRGHERYSDDSGSERQGLADCSGGRDAGVPAIRNLVVLCGRYFDDSDSSTVSKVCLVSEHLAQTAFADGDPVAEESIARAR